MRPLNRALQFLRGAGLRFDWPSSTQWQTSLSAHDPNPPITLESAPVRGAAFDNPGKLRFAGESTVAVNLLLTTLAVVVVAAAPFYQSHWANPQAVAGTAWRDTAPNLLTSTLATAPFRQSDWPVPLVTSARQLEPAPNLLGSTLAPALSPFIPADLLLLQSPRWQQPEAFPNIVLGSPPDAGVPFVPVDFPLPQAVARAFWYDPPNLLLATLAGDAPVEAVVVDWIVRARRRGRR